MFTRTQALRGESNNTQGRVRFVICLIRRFTSLALRPARSAARTNNSGVRSLSGSGRPAINASADIGRSSRPIRVTSDASKGSSRLPPWLATSHWAAPEPSPARGSGAPASAAVSPPTAFADPSGACEFSPSPPVRPAPLRRGEGPPVAAGSPRPCSSGSLGELEVIAVPSFAIRSPRKPPGARQRARMRPSRQRTSRYHTSGISPQGHGKHIAAAEAHGPPPRHMGRRRGTWGAAEAHGPRNLDP